MSTTLRGSRRQTGKKRDRFPYGWRLRPVVRPNGAEDFERIPLTLEDVLHPQEEDFIVESPSHWTDVFYLHGVFLSRITGRKGWVVVSDCRVDWGVPGIKAHGPDVAVFSSVKLWDPEIGTFYVTRHRAKKRLAVEVSSKAYRKNDLETKIDEYYRAGVPLYVIAYREKRREGSRLRILGYRAGPTGYEPLEPDEHGRLWLEPFQLWVGVKDERVACYDGATGEEIGDYTAIKQAFEAQKARAESEKARAESERARADAAEARIQDLERELRTRQKNKNHRNSG